MELVAKIIACVVGAGLAAALAATAAVLLFEALRYRRRRALAPGASSMKPWTEGAAGAPGAEESISGAVNRFLDADRQVRAIVMLEFAETCYEHGLDFSIKANGTVHRVRSTAGSPRAVTIEGFPRLPLGHPAVNHHLRAMLDAHREACTLFRDSALDLPGRARIPAPGFQPRTHKRRKDHEQTRTQAGEVPPTRDYP